jgi:hypothetical protein
MELGLGDMWKEVIVAYCTGIRVHGRRKMHTNLNEETGLTDDGSVATYAQSLLVTTASSACATIIVHCKYFKHDSVSNELSACSRLLSAYISKAGVFFRHAQACPLPSLQARSSQLMAREMCCEALVRFYDTVSS